MPETELKRCARCTARYAGPYCSVCSTRLERAEHPRKMTSSELLSEVRSWLGCKRETLPVDANAWARRMAVILGRDVSIGEITRIEELVGEASAKLVAGQTRKLPT